MPTTIVPQFGALSATGFYREVAGFGVPGLPTGHWPMSGNNLMLDPGLFSPKLMFGHRDLNTYPLYGQYKNSGSVTGSVFPTNGALLIPGSIGPDASPGYGVTGSSPASTTTISTNITAGSANFSLTLATGYAVGSIIQVDVNNTATPTTTECRKIATLSGTTGTVSTPFTYAHTSGVTVSTVTAPYTHTIQQANVLGSYTIEKNLGGFESLQFAGARVNKLSVTATTTDTEAQMTADFIAQSVAVLDSPTQIAVIPEAPFVFPEGTLSLFSQTLAQATSFTMDIENALASTYTFNQSHDLQYLTPTTLHVSGKVDVVWDSFDDSTWGYFTRMLNAGNGALSFALAHPAAAGSVTLNASNVYLKGVPDNLKMEDIITSTLEYEAFLNYSVNTTVGAVVVDSSYLAL